MTLDSEIWKMSATVLTAAIRQGKLSSEEIVRQSLERISALDGHTNSFVTVDGDAALAAARAADVKRQKGGVLPPLHGVPVSVKDVIVTAGMRTTYGSTLMAGNVPENDAEAVARLRRAGAIIIGKTTTSEFAHKALTDSPLTGETRNPWALDRVPGGSSGGAGVAAAMGYAALNVSTDGGGSSRVPAACCGVLGLKPTMGSIPNETAQDVFGLQVIGAITRTISDLHMVYRTMAGPFSGDPLSLGKSCGQAVDFENSVETLKGLRIRWLPLMGNRRLSTCLMPTFQALISRFESAGAKVFDDGDIDWALDACQVLMRAQQAQRFRRLPPEQRQLLDRSLVRCIEEGESQNVETLQSAILARTGLYHRLQTMFETADVLLSPVVASRPPRIPQDAHEPMLIDGHLEGPIRDAWHSYMIPINATGHPAISIPCGLDAEGLPVGAQLVGPWHSESLLFRIGAALETLNPWADRWPPLAVRGGRS